MARKSTETVIPFGPFRFDLQTHALTKDQKPLDIPYRLAVILKCLIQNRPKTVRCIDPGLSEVFSSMGENVAQKHDNFRKYMSELRSLLGASEFDKCIMNHPKKRRGESWGGYSFFGTVVSERGRNRTNANGLRSLVRIIERDDIDSLLGRPEKRIAIAHEEIWVSGNDNAYIETISNFLEDELESRKKIRLLGVAPRKHLVEALALIDPRFAKGDFKQKVDMASAHSATECLSRQPELFFLLRWKPRGPAERLMGDRWKVQVHYER